MLERWHLDGWLLLSLMAVLGFGLIVLYSAGGGDSALVTRQAVRIVAGLGVMVLLAQWSPERMESLSPWLWLIGSVLLVLVLVLGSIGKGAQRWIDLGLFRLQPSELLKLIVPMTMAWLLARRALPPSPLTVIQAVLILGIPAGLIVVEPDLGTALLVGVSGVFVLLLAGLRWRWLLISAALALAAAPFLWNNLHSYQQNRILTFLEPERDPLNTGYHIIQSKIAIGSGGLTGKGWMQGTQSQLEFLPEPHTDFIFAVLAEEQGLLGVLVLVLLYGLVLGRGFIIALRADRTYNRLLAGAVVLTFFVYIFVNIGMVSGLLPVVGVPLPLVSYGGTSMVSLLASFGLLMSVHSHKRLVPT